MTGATFLLGFVLGALFVVLIVCIFILWDSQRVHRLDQTRSAKTHRRSQAE